MPYRVVQDFLRIEAVSTQGTNAATPADPITLVVTVVDSVLPDSVVETVQMTETSRLWRSTVGRWLFELDPAVLTPGKTYTITYTYSMHPGTSSVARQNIEWRPQALVPHDENHCVLTGTLLDIQGAPLSNQTLTIEQYADIVTMTRRVQQAVVRTDAFGAWQLELPFDAIVRVVFGDVTKVVRIPRVPTATLGSLSPVQLKAVVTTDRFGYPIPGAPADGAWEIEAPEDAVTHVHTAPSGHGLPPGGLPGQVLRPDGDNVVWAPADVTSGLVYNVDGSLAAVHTERGSKLFTYNPDGTLAKITGSGDYQTKLFTYDPSGQLTTITVP